MFQKPNNSTTLISAHQPRRPNRVGEKDRRQFALLTRQRHLPDSYRKRRGTTLVEQQGQRPGPWPSDWTRDTRTTLAIWHSPAALPTALPKAELGTCRRDASAVH